VWIPYDDARTPGKDAMGITDTVKGWFGKAKEQGTELAAEAEPYLEKAKEQGAEVAEKTQDFAHDAMDTKRSRVDEFRSAGHFAAELQAAASDADGTVGEAEDNTADQTGD
jgi:hypothetical protein